MINNSTIKQFNNFDNNGDGYTVTGTNYRKRVKQKPFHSDILSIERAEALAYQKSVAAELCALARYF